MYENRRLTGWSKYEGRGVWNDYFTDWTPHKDKAISQQLELQEFLKQSPSPHFIVKSIEKTTVVLDLAFGPFSLVKEMREAQKALEHCTSSEEYLAQSEKTAMLEGLVDALLEDKVSISEEHKRDFIARHCESMSKELRRLEKTLLKK